jgi:hypothetical protein
VTNPQGPPGEEPSVWARPGSESPPAEPATPTEPVPPAEAPTTDLPEQPHPPPAQDVAGPVKTTPVKTKRRLDAVSVTLVLVIVVALLCAALVGAELYARHRADDVVAAATECVVQDKVSVSFGPSPFLLQHLRGHYGDIKIHTAGNQLRSAKGMKADINVDNVDLHGSVNSKGTIGALDAGVTWTSEGIKETVQHAVPFVGGLVNTVTTDPSAGTVELSGALGLGSVTVKPQVADNGLALQVTKVTAMGAPVPHETAQSALDIFASTLTKDFPLGIHADSVQVTDDGVVAHFSTRNASIPSAQDDPCFAKL